MEQFDSTLREAEAGDPWVTAHPRFLKQVPGGPPEGAPPYPLVLVAPGSDLFLALPAAVADHWKAQAGKETAPGSDGDEEEVEQAGETSAETGAVVLQQAGRAGAPGMRSGGDAPL